MAKFGIIYTAFNTQSYVGPSLVPWAKAREEKWGGHEFVICAVSCPFNGFQVDGTDNTLTILQQWLGANAIDCIITQDKPVDETDARGQALKWLKTKGVDFIWQVDSDEFFKQADIERIAAFVSKSIATWFKVSYKNYVFDLNTYLVEPFTPARIHRVKLSGFEADSFWDDNNVTYKNNATGETKMDNSFANLTIPKTIAWVHHYTWLNTDRSRLKIEYQKSRNWVCSFDWDKNLGLVWNKIYFTSKGLPIPETACD